MSYLAVKHAHMMFAIISIVLFMLRAWLAVPSPARINNKLLKILPHINDTLLLLCGIWLAVSINQIPFGNSPWLTAKVIGLVCYIIVGTIAIKRGKTRGQRLTAALAAIAIFAYIYGAAISKSPLSWLAL
ncbi:SirB2 family protein [Oceanimonas baumannii]|uniref:Membrane protein SirB2 n=1 Tax=Oceanimonas baumannii TaxID=129578 RepID=A0A235CGA3_9GAMM|nr:SirB2 family protein [Oceanimonas baumannii]MCC4264375.1 SirB2 family protein [Oceanimonas baumannii]OYD23638.1 regulator SirB [Oceanimonas baumannii]TDW55830.1 putative membrane protein SirB2 [Oceanimonas baumannii]